VHSALDRLEGFDKGKQSLFLDAGQMACTKNCQKCVGGQAGQEQRCLDALSQNVDQYALVPHELDAKGHILAQDECFGGAPQSGGEVFQFGVVGA